MLHILGGDRPREHLALQIEQMFIHSYMKAIEQEFQPLRDDARMFRLNSWIPPPLLDCPGHRPKDKKRDEEEGLPDEVPEIRIRFSATLASKVLTPPRSSLSYTRFFAGIVCLVG